MGEAQMTLGLPGTSWVAGSFMTPMLHFVGRPLPSSDGSVFICSPSFEVEFCAKKDRQRFEFRVRTSSVSGRPSVAILPPGCRRLYLQLNFADWEVLFCVATPNARSS